MESGEILPPDAAPPEALGSTWPPPRLEWTARDADFIADIREHPDDDTPRRIYADWLMDLGDPRGLFIQTDIDCLLESDPLRMRRLLRDRRWLLQRYERWWSPADRVTAIGGFTRGFLESITMTPEELLQHGPAIFEREPVHELHLICGENPPEPEILDCACLNYVSRLRLELQSSVGWGTLFSSPRLERLAAVTVQRSNMNLVPIDDTLSLTRSRHFSRIKLFRCAGLEVMLLDFLLFGSGFAIERLEVPGWCEVRPGAYIGDEPVLIPHESIGRLGLMLLARHPASRSLRYLDVSYNPVAEVLPVLLASPHLANLQTIRVSEREAIDFQALRNARLETSSL